MATFIFIAVAVLVTLGFVKDIKNGDGGIWKIVAIVSANVIALSWLGYRFLNLDFGGFIATFCMFVIVTILAFFFCS